MKSLLYLAHNIARSNFGRMDYPFKLTFIVTYRCNLRCRMCHIWDRKDPRPEIGLNEIERFFSRSNFFSWINLSGGEIFLREDMVEIIRVILAANKRLYLLDFPTNGFMPDIILKSVSEILTCRPRRVIITVSLDGPEDLHNELRGHPDTWQRTVRTFINLNKLAEKHKNLQVYFGLTVMPQNTERLNETYLAIKSKIPYIRPGHLHLNLAHSSEHYYGNKDSRYLPEKTAYGPINDFLKTRRYSLHPVNILERKYQRLIKDYFQSGKTPLPCQALSSSCFIDPYGDIFPCSIYNKRVGNLRDYDFDLKRLWNSEEVKMNQKKIAGGACPQCWTPCEAYQTLLGNLIRW